MQKEFTTPFEEISLQELNKCLQKFYFSQENAMAINFGDCMPKL